MKDVQNLTDVRGIPIQKVGVNDVHLPFLIKTKAGSFQSVLARIRLTVSTPFIFGIINSYINLIINNIVFFFCFT